MHEIGLIESMIAQAQEALARAGVEQGEVTSVRFQRGTTISEDVLRQAFDVLSKGTQLEGAEVIIDTIDQIVACACGYSQTVTSDDLVGHIFICPQCDAVHQIGDSHDVNLIEVNVTQDVTEAERQNIPG